jgi:hydroxypyruvate reductase
MTGIDQARRDLLKIYQAGIEGVNGRRAVSAHLETHPLTGNWSVIAIGKAAQAMAQGAADVLGDRLSGGLVISKTGHLDPRWLASSVFLGVESSHPVPDQRSIDAGRQLLAFIAQQPEHGQLLFLISGGASSLVEVLPEGVALDDLQALNRWMLGNGWSIDRMNQVRRSVSLIKGGGLLNYLGERQVAGLLISDVPGDDPTVIGSGLLVSPTEPGPSSALAELPDWVARLTALGADRPVARKTVELTVVANLRQAREAAAETATQLGYKVNLSHAMICGDVLTVARRMALELSDSLPGVFIWGGETTITLPEQPGRGGRNQHLALAAARVLDGHDDVCFLAAGSDGTDGPGEDAGALVDGATLARGRRQGLEADDCLARADSGTFLEASGDLVNTGPTGTNVMDLMIGIKL